MKRILGIGLLLIAAAFSASAYAAEKKIGPISTVTVHQDDIVDPAHPLGTVELAYRTGDSVHYFATAESCGEYAANPAKYGDTDPGVRLAFFGADIVARFPDGVKSPRIGNVINGNTAVTASYNGATYAFADEADKATFVKEPTKFVPPVGGYCLLAMSKSSIVPGDPRNVFFVPEVGTWAVFGSPNGPIAMAAMTAKQRIAVYRKAIENYQRLNRSDDDKLAKN